MNKIDLTGKAFTTFVAMVMFDTLLSIFTGMMVIPVIMGTFGLFVVIETVVIGMGFIVLSSFLYLCVLIYVTVRIGIDLMLWDNVTDYTIQYTTIPSVFYIFTIAYTEFKMLFGTSEEDSNAKTN